MRSLLSLWLTLALVATAACGGAESSSDDTLDTSISSDSDVGHTPDTVTSPDATTTQDAEPTQDTEPTEDADTTATVDAEPTPDAEPTQDAEPTEDADTTATADAAEEVGDPAPEGCRSHAECVDSDSQFGMYCSTPYDANVCGIPPMEECATDEQCGGPGPAGADLVCHAVQDGCSPNGIGAMCDLSCANIPTMCGDQSVLVCGPDGACTPKSCLDGYACHAVQLCDPAANDADPHGCSFVSCQDDADCAPDLYCVIGMCIETLGTCAEEMLVP
ncbi:MAG: hypothetical protein QF464_07060 [Myxococcota bacterium]|jgi:hypothetical protein|nr:hypothetical protein [Myxococcota bacterium]